MERNGWRRVDRIDYITSGWKGMDGREWIGRSGLLYNKINFWMAGGGGAKEGKVGGAAPQ